MAAVIHDRPLWNRLGKNYLLPHTAQIRKDCDFKTSIRQSLTNALFLEFITLSTFRVFSIFKRCMAKRAYLNEGEGYREIISTI
jgi:hypothetical protein